jgi:hypothetical protein
MSAVNQTMPEYKPVAADAPLNQRLALPDSFTSDDLTYFTEEEVKSLRDQGILDPLVDPAAPPPQTDPVTTDATAPQDQQQTKPEEDAAQQAQQAQQVQQQDATAQAQQTKYLTEAEYTSLLRQIPDVSGAQAEVAAAKADMDALMKKFGEMEVTDADFATQQNAIIERRVAAQAKIQAAEQIQRDNYGLFTEYWSGLVNGYMDANPVLREEGVLTQFDAALRRINAAAENSDLPLQTRITMAHLDVSAINPKVRAAQAATANAAPAQPQSQAQQEPERQRPAPLTTLASVPAAGANDPGNGRFAAMDAEPDVFRAEAGFGAMTQAEQEAYLRG